ncbi:MULTISPECIES: DUF3472 domain-containing protein [unclassified Mucilaginibacter]|uniref:DUF3472 domain-containing protein n=1 Tax=unclassified Mucilaginibacter TaxID=2617802 RepID=UPI00095F9F6B|nr:MULTISPECIES: DUF3472 domain-containing protein [unclassified Mucilaginibacter]OJW13317.1 MAG: hypothetical protein BGO48_00740 [Mucilaginibacter sp. 44-25]PLW90127.1 MAG: nematoblast specific protein [Mucilaginibacter sp.]HEK21468.1 DUF3472 domain-containing protein [Bacteroidota bacterium]
MNKIVSNIVLQLSLFIITSAAFAQNPAIDVKQLQHIIPLGGNAWINRPDSITDDGLFNWSGRNTTANIYFRIGQPQNIKLSLRIRVPKGTSTIRVNVGHTTFTKKLSNPQFDTVYLGKIYADKPGNIKVTLKGINKKGPTFADVSDLIVGLQQPDADIAYVPRGSSFHFGRRGPSVHLSFQVPEDKRASVKYFYNEIMVPNGEDVIGSYFMADGFGEGYFGMQVNSASERRVLFSVWSPYSTDNPESIPDSLRIKMIKRGAGVHTGEFGNEGSGGQSYMRYPWKAGKVYGFLLSAEPDFAKKTTTYTAYFKDVAAGKWLLVASFSRPQKATYLTHLHSFLENFEPENGNITRKAYYTNEWIGDVNGDWTELTQAIFTGDATANANYRKDYAGGADGSKFYLQNGGFFNDFTKLKIPVSRKPTHVKPAVDLKNLPGE